MDPFFITFIIFIIIFGISVIGLLFSEKGSDGGTVAAIAATLTGVIAILAFLMSTFVVVQTQHLGEEITFGKPKGTLTNGFHWKAPAAKVKRYDGTLQTERYSSDKDDDGDPIQVLLANGSQAKVNVTYQWRLDSTNIDAIYRNYPNSDTSVLNGNVVKREVQLALNDAYGTYDPYASLEAQQSALVALAAGQAAPSISPSFTYLSAAKAAQAQATAALKPQDITFVSLTISSISFDAGTQARLNELSQANVNKITAAAIASANQKITANPPTPAQNIQDCIATTAKNPSAYPAGWNCFGGTSTVLAGK